MTMLLIILSLTSLAIAIVLAALLWRLVREERRRSDARVQLLMELSSSPAGDATLDTRLFEPADERSPWVFRAAIGAAFAAAAIVSFAGWSAFARPDAAPAAVADAVPPLELLTLGHEQEAGTLSVTGVVRNAPQGAPIANVTATLTLFDKDGRELANASTPLDFLMLGPGHESEFVIRVPQSGQAVRYRVGFRDAQGRALRHVDRRSVDAVARQEAS